MWKFCVVGRREEFSCSLAHIDLNSFPTSIKNSMIKSTLETIYSRKVISERKKLNCDKKMKKFSKKSFSPQIWKLSKFIFRSTLSWVKINFIPHNFLLKINYEAAGKKTYLIIFLWWEKLSQFTWKSQWLSQFFIITDNFPVVSKFTFPQRHPTW